MASEWNEVTVSEIASPDRNALVGGPFGSNLVSKDYVGEGVPVIRGHNMGERWISSEFVYVTPEKAESLTANLARPWDIIFTQRGTLGQVALVPEKPFERYLVSQSQMKLTVDRAKADPLFYYYVFQSPEQQAYIHRNTIQTGVPHTNLGILRNAPVPFPPLPEQRAIAAILGALDDKIELNRRMSRTLEAIAQALFKQWFVDGAEEGWEEKTVSEVVDVNPTRPLKKGETATYLDMANMPTQGHRAIEWVKRPFGSGTRFINGDTLLARITPCLENGKTAFVDFLNDKETGWGSTEFIVLRPKPPLPTEFGYYLARDENFRNHVIQNMTGTSGRQRTPASCFNNFSVAVPPTELAKKFGDFAKSVIDKVRANDEESRTLASLRDTLLPRLMRGEVRVKDV